MLYLGLAHSAIIRLSSPIPLLQLQRSTGISQLGDINRKGSRQATPNETLSEPPTEPHFISSALLPSSTFLISFCINNTATWQRFYRQSIYNMQTPALNEYPQLFSGNDPRFASSTEDTFQEMRASPMFGQTTLLVKSKDRLEPGRM